MNQLPPLELESVQDFTSFCVVPLCPFLAPGDKYNLKFPVYHSRVF